MYAIRRNLLPMRNILSKMSPVEYRNTVLTVSRSFTSTRISLINHDFRHSRTVEDDAGSENEAEFYRKHDEQYSGERFREGSDAIGSDTDDDANVDPEEEVSNADLETIEDDLVMFEITKDKNEIETELYFTDFTEAMSFMNFAALKLNQLGYEPDWSNAGSCVVIRLGAQEKKRVTYHDVQAAYEIEELIRRHFRHVNDGDYDEEDMEEEETAAKGYVPRKRAVKNRGDNDQNLDVSVAEKEEVVADMAKRFNIDMDELKKEKMTDVPENAEEMEKFLAESGIFDGLEKELGATKDEVLEGAAMFQNGVNKGAAAASEDVGFTPDEWKDLNSRLESLTEKDLETFWNKSLEETAEEEAAVGEAAEDETSVSTKGESDVETK